MSSVSRRHDGASASDVIFTLGCGALCRPAEILSEETARLSLSGVLVCLI